MHRRKYLPFTTRPLTVMVTLLLAFLGHALAQSEKVLHAFTGGNDGAIGDQESFTYGGLVQDKSGNFYGTTPYGGGSAFCSLFGSAQGCGAVFELTPGFGASWTETVLYAFAVDGAADAVGPTGGLVRDAAGNLYGTAITGQGIYQDGVVFELSPPAPPGGAWTETILYAFGTLAFDGASPNGNLVFDTDGNLYGTTGQGGKYNSGTVFALSPSSPGGAWTETVLYSFGSNGGDGRYPLGGPIIDSSGNLYGTTTNGGPLNYGTVYQLLTPTNPANPWGERILYRFQGGPDGAYPYGGLATNKQFLYGTTRGGGAGGTVYQLTPSGGSIVHTVLYNFSGGQDGTQPHAGLAIDPSGNLYGTTTFDGAFNYGTVFQLQPPSGGGMWTENQYSFRNGNDGSRPVAPVVYSGGAVYGLTSQGGDLACSINSEPGCGTVFRIAP